MKKLITTFVLALGLIAAGQISADLEITVTETTPPASPDEHALVEVSVVASWPYYYRYAGFQTAKAGVKVHTFEETPCSNRVKGSTCDQRWLLHLNVKGACTLDGEYTLIFRELCMDASCGKDFESAEFTLDSGNFCD